MSLILPLLLDLSISLPTSGRVARSTSFRRRSVCPYPPQFHTAAHALTTLCEQTRIERGKRKRGSERERLIQTVALVLFSLSSLSFSPPPFGPTIFLPPENLPFHAGRRGRGGGRGVRSVRTGRFKWTVGCVIRM